MNSIWDHLTQLVTEKRTTIILTTHYVDEAKGSNMVGMMRDGRLIAEENPVSLMTHFDVTSLEDVFFQLSKEQDSKASNSNTSPTTFSVKETPSFQSDMQRHLTRKSSTFAFETQWKNSTRRVKAIVGKNITARMRSLW